MVEQKTQTVEVREPTNEQIGKTHVSVPDAKTQGGTQIMVIDQKKSNENKDIPNDKKQEAIQTLVNLPTISSPNKVLQMTRKEDTTTENIGQKPTFVPTT